MPCDHCTRAATGPWYGLNTECHGCRVREIARGPEHFEAKQAGFLTGGYRARLHAAGVTHADVKAATSIERSAA